MNDIRETIIEKYNMGDCLGFEALKNIATEEDCKELDELIEISWKVVDSTYENEDEYHKRKRNIFIKYGFKFDDLDDLIA